MLIKAVQFLLVSCIILIFCTETAAKTRSFRPRDITTATGDIKTKIRDFESRLRPYLEHKRNHTIHRFNSGGKSSGTSLESDLLSVRYVWKYLSQEFKTLYSQVATIPDSSLMFVSPGGNFEIFYKKKGIDAVDTTDLYMFGEAGNWRVKRPLKNGVPDYVDEVAWQFDSVWSLEIEKLGYVQPLPYKTQRYNSDRYKVVIADQDRETYGVTLLSDSSATGKGWTSFIVMNNAWPISEWSNFDYSRPPWNGARVTSAHEFFHAIQYTMAWDVDSVILLDEFPLSWIEASAVVMEELAFDSVDDYIQYSSDFFSWPTLPLLNRNTPTYVNTALLLFLNQFITNPSQDEFIKTTFFSNYNTPFVNFHTGLRQTSALYGTSWTDILNQFHTRSYFTGTRSKNNLFINDAPLLSKWNYTIDTPDTAGTIRKTASPYGMQIFAIQPNPNGSDTLNLTFRGPVTAAGDYKQWAVSCIHRTTQGDSIIQMDINANGQGQVSLPSWKSSLELLTIASNGYENGNKVAAVTYNAGPFTNPPSETSYLQVFPNPAKLSSGRGIRFKAEIISSVVIYTASGRFVCTVPEIAGAHTWDLTNGSSRKIIPGLYRAVITIQNPYNTTISETKYKNILVIP